MEQVKYDILLKHLNKGVYHYYVTSKYESEIQDIGRKYPDSEFNWLIDTHYEYLLHCYDESVNTNEDPHNKLNNCDYLEGLTTDECNELLQNFKSNLLPIYENDYNDARKSLIKNCSWLTLIIVLICIAVYCALYIYPDEAKTISRFGKILGWGVLYFGFMVYYKTKNYLQERNNYHRFKLGLENFKL